MSSDHFQLSRLDSLQRYAQEQVDRAQFAGLAWCIEQGGNVINRGEIGHTDHAQSKTVQPDTLYRIYSMTKPVVSVRALQLVEAGKLRLSDPVERWIPGFSRAQVLSSQGALQAVHRAITIEDLLTHRAGLSYDFLPDCAVAERYREARLAEDGSRTLSELVGILASIPLACQPGERWYYSYSTDVLAEVLSCVCEQSIGDCLAEGVFGPLNMSDTGFEVSPDSQARVADMFGQRQLGQVDSGLNTRNKLQAMDVEASYPVHSKGAFGRGGIGLFSTLDDYRAFMGVLNHGRTPEGETLLGSAMLDMLWHNRLSAEQMPIAIGKNRYEGYGWGLAGRVMAELSSASVLTVPGEGGWSGAASTHFWVDRANDIHGIVMAQYLGSAQPLGQDIQSLAYAAWCPPA